MTTEINSGSGKKPHSEVGTSLEILSDEKIAKYKEGCELVGIALNDAVNKIIDDGKKPTILIPSRGAVPIFLLAMEYLGRDEKDSKLVTSSRIRYDPTGIFRYLSDNRIHENESLKFEDDTDIDIILYPFTADVSTDSEHGEELARDLRRSCARAFIDLVYKGKSSPDLLWNFFLLGKLQPKVFSEFGSSPAQVVESLRNVPADENRRIVLIDTVISGRAASNITEAFNDLSYPVVPILAVDSSSGGVFQQTYRGKIEKSMNYQYIDDIGSQFFDFPLISEDKGAALLGVSAINFANFNMAGFFNSVDNRFPPDFTPQSCLWVTPPKEYTELFHAFLGRVISGLDESNEEMLRSWNVTQVDIKQMTKGRSDPSSRELNAILPVKALKANARESSSHIVSISIDPEQANQWVKEFSAQVDLSQSGEKNDIVK